MSSGPPNPTPLSCPIAALIIVVAIATGPTFDVLAATIGAAAGERGSTVLVNVPPAAIRAAAREAYVWGWPLAYVHQCRTRVALVPRAGTSGGLPVAPLNELAMLTDQIAPRSGFVPCPSRDVLYGFGVFDLAVTPVVVQVPDFGDRFWLFQLGDQRTDSFAELGSMYASRPGFYLVVGPAWSGVAPPGITRVFHCPTRHAYCIPRVFFTSAPEDRSAAASAVATVMAYPLAEFTGVPRRRDWSKLGWLPNLGRREHTMTPERFLRILPDLIEDVPPLPGEESLYERLRQLVVAITTDKMLADIAREALHEAERDVVSPLSEFRNVGQRLPAGWTTIVNGGAFGTDYLTRTAVARSTVFVNRHHETKYYYLDVDVTGKRLEGAQTYTITFPNGRLPPAHGFWSLTAYDARHALASDTSGRHSVGSRDVGLRVSPDGSLTIVVGRAGGAADGSGAAPGAAANRVAPPGGAFSLCLRLYAPRAEALENAWTPPPLMPAHMTASRGRSRADEIGALTRPSGGM